MENTAPRRRGRPPVDRDQIVKAEIVTSETRAVEPAGRRRRRKALDGLAQKLAAPKIPGHTTRFVNDDGNRLAELQELGYEFVPSGTAAKDGVGSRVSRLVGTKANGEPMHAYLMETPDELYAQGVDEREATVRQTDEAIRAGRDQTGQIENIHSRASHGSITSSAEG